MSDGRNVKFIVSQKKSNNCICYCCHSTGTVLVVKIPETKYFDGWSLSKKYHSFWICRTCADKLAAALKGGAE